MTELKDEEIEAFKKLAESDLPVSKWAKKILEAKGIR